jgi:hypothetical protein
MMRGRVSTCVLGGALFSFVAGAQSADEVIAHNVAARGGKDKVEGVQTARLRGTLRFDTGGTVPITVERARPTKTRTEIRYLDDRILVLVYNDGQGWKIDPFAPEPTVVALTGQELQYMSEEADDEPFVAYKGKGHRVELLGKEPIEGRQAYRLRVTLRNGDVNDFFFDAESGLEVKWEGRREAGGRQVLLESSFHDYRAVDGVQFPFRIDSGPKGDAQHLNFESIEVNVPLPAERFAKPSLPRPAHRIYPDMTPWQVQRPAGVPQASVAFRLVVDQSAPGTIELQGPDGKPLMLAAETVLTQRDITKVEVGSALTPPYFQIYLHFSPDAAQRLHQLSSHNILRRLAIVVDRRVLIAATIHSTLDSPVLIEGAYTRADAIRMAERLAP